MLDLNIRKISAKNFVCFGPEGIEIDFTKMSNIVLVKGENHDVDVENSSNGTGKSSLIDVVVYAIFGKGIKGKLNHGNMIHNKIGKDLEVVVEMDKYKIRRTRSKNSLKLWEKQNDEWVEITQGGMPATQKKIEEIVGLNYEAFVNTVVFTDNSMSSFLECDKAAKRSIVENLLSLEKYRGFSDNAKEVRKKYQDSVKSIENEYKNLLVEESTMEQRLKQVDAQEFKWTSDKNAALNELVQTKSRLEKKLLESDEGADILEYEKVQAEITELNEWIVLKNGILSETKGVIDVGTDQYKKLDKELRVIESDNSKFDLEIKEINNDIDRKSNNIKSIESKDGNECPTCFGSFDKSRFASVLENAINEIEVNQNKLKVLNEKKELLKEDISARKDKLKEMQSVLQQANTQYDSLFQTTHQKQNRISELNKIPKPQLGQENNLIKVKLDGIGKQISGVEIELKTSPYLEIKNTLTEDLENKKNEIKSKNEELRVAQNEIPFYDFWVKAFGENGIRKFIIDGIIPPLNSRLNYWMDCLIDGAISVQFDNELQETIQREPADGDPFVYSAMSGGERRRLNLAVSQAFAYIMMLNTGVVPSLIFLDEVTTNIDPSGVHAIYKMIQELSKDKQVFITTHDQELLSMLNGCDTIFLKKIDGFTKIEN